MKKVIIKQEENALIINLNDIDEYTPIFARRNYRLAGMVVREYGKGWILRIGGDAGNSGHFNSREECMERAMEFGYEFVIE